ncbi:hypothetical protein MAR_030874 [Mya arenaria]|uniref:Uncharacterized protein n=1 Tax=Mya arenaria TaxID=6604 RepID=A0ABY7F285_MYAAR|nr:hypothetical protein MAR_030874 [Mya arenaria]
MCVLQLYTRDIPVQSVLPLAISVSSPDPFEPLRIVLNGCSLCCDSYLGVDNYDEIVSLDNDNFLNSLVDAQAFSVYSSPNNNTRQYTYSYF